jgi:hypothetical protein
MGCIKKEKTVRRNRRAIQRTNLKRKKKEKVI